MTDRVQIRQNFTLGSDGDKAEVARVLQVGERWYVEIDQTMDAGEPTIMVAVIEALDQFEQKVRANMELCYGEA